MTTKGMGQPHILCPVFSNSWLSKPCVFIPFLPSCSATALRASWDHCSLSPGSLSDFSLLVVLWSCLEWLQIWNFYPNSQLTDSEPFASRRLDPIGEELSFTSTRWYYKHFLSLTKKRLWIIRLYFILQKKECPNFGVIWNNGSVLKLILVDLGSLCSKSVIKLWCRTNSVSI